MNQHHPPPERKVRYYYGRDTVYVVKRANSYNAIR